MAFVFGACALAAVILSVFVMVSRPFGCSANSDSPVVTCDWVTSRVIAAGWLAAGLAVSVIAWKRWKLALAIVSVSLIALSVVSIVGAFAMAPAALWCLCALWLWARGRRYPIVLSGLASVVLLYPSATGVVGLSILHSTPI